MNLQIYVQILALPLTDYVTLNYSLSKLKFIYKIIKEKQYYLPYKFVF